MSRFQYCTLTEAKRQLQMPVEETYHDAHLTGLIEAASHAVKNYLGDKSAYEIELDEDDEPIALDSNYEPLLDSFGDSATAAERVRPVVKQAVLLCVTHFFRFRAGENMTPGYLPPAVVSLLYPLRDPVFK